MTLPIDSILPETLRLLSQNPCLVIMATPGSGKTTRVPPAILESDFARGKQVWVLEPRRLAAKYAARRVADERGENVGDTVGFHFRHEHVAGPKTRLLFLTEGMLLRRLIRDPKLGGVAAVVLDEFHERHLHGDVALAYLRQLQNTSRPDLKLVVMSATLDTEGISAALGKCPVQRLETRQFPVEIFHSGDKEDKPLEQRVRQAVKSLLATAQGDFLVFLPGMAEIRRCESALAELRTANDLIILPLHGDLTREEQDVAIQKSKRRKVILATNVAETSLTIEGVTEVIDSGLHRMASFSWWAGIPALKTRPISKASAIQRTGRAGRTAPGRCTRLYSKADFEGRSPFETPEIGRSDLSQTLLELKSMSVGDPLALPWLEAPPKNAVEGALQLLRLLGALDETERLTKLGKRLSSLPMHPRLGRLLVEAESQGVLQHAVTLVALLSESRPLTFDALDSLEGQVDPFLQRARAQMTKAIGLNPDPDVAQWRDPLARCVLAAFPDRVAKRRDASTANRIRTDEAELVMSSGGSAKVAAKDLPPDRDLFVILDVQEMKASYQLKSHWRVRAIVPLEEEWLFSLEPNRIKEEESLEWDKVRKLVSAKARITYGSLVLLESAGQPTEESRVAELLAWEVLRIKVDTLHPLSDWPRVLGPVAGEEAIEGVLARAELWTKYNGKTPLDSASITKAVLLALAGCRSEAQIRAINWPERLTEALVGSASSILHRQLPTSISLPGGRRTEVNYRLQQTPWVASRLQDFFGMKQGPALMEGKLPLTIHLLAPNKRALQVTSDLTGFWKTHYPTIRKELGRKYPRHSWPENPLVAVPPKSKPR